MMYCSFGAQATELGHWKLTQLLRHMQQFFGNAPSTLHFCKSSATSPAECLHCYSLHRQRHGPQHADRCGIVVTDHSKPNISGSLQSDIADYPT